MHSMHMLSEKTKVRRSEIFMSKFLISEVPTLRSLRTDLVREHSTKRTDGIFHRPCTRTTTHRPAQHELALCDRCHTAWASGAHGWVPAGHPRYTRADFGQEAVGGSTTTTRARKRHATRDTQCEHQVCCSPEREGGTKVVNTETGGNQTAW